MELVKPMRFDEAVDKIGGQTIVGSTLNTEQWREVPIGLRDNAFFSATVENARFLQRAKDTLGDFLTGAKETLANGETLFKAGGRSDFVKQLQAFAVAEGMGPLKDGASGGLQDISSQRRLELIFDTKTQQAADYGYWKQGQDPDVLDEFPAQRFIREADVQKPRPLHQQNEGVVRLKSDLEFWVAMNSPLIGGFGVPWGPWGFNSGMGVEDVDRAEAESMGLLTPGQPVAPVDKDFNEQLQASTAGLDPALLDTLRESFGDQVEFDGDSVRWRAATAAAPQPGALPGALPTPAPEVLPSPAREDVRPPLAPVSAALNIQPTVPKIRADAVKKALAVIDSVHSDGTLPQIPVVKASRNAGYMGAYVWRPPGAAVEIRVNAMGEMGEHVVTHEAGHFLDHQALDVAGRYASENSPLMADWRKAIEDSQAVKDLRKAMQTARLANEGGVVRRYEYLLSGRELFARSYAQWVTEKSGNAALVAQLPKIRTAMGFLSQWEPEDFAPISAALDAVFKSKGWL